jgi:putative ABC transport system substrate-binding protein
MEPRYLRNPYAQLPADAADLVRRQVDVIVAIGTAAAKAAKEATSSIPVVLMVAGDPVSAGLATSLARPGGNLTGVSMMASEMATKRLELLKEVAPRARRVGVLFSPDIRPLREAVLGSLTTTAAALGVELRPIDVLVADELPRTFARLAADRADAIFVYGAMFLDEKERALELARKHRLPAIFYVSDFVDAGGLMSFGANFADAGGRAAYYVDKILKGARPGDLPIEQAVRFELVINLRTAKVLGLTVPQALLLRADRVIE